MHCFKTPFSLKKLSICPCGGNLVYKAGLSGETQRNPHEIA